MASLMAKADSPQHHNNLISTAKPSQPLQVSIALKEGIHGIDSQQYHHPTVLQEIPTRISPSVPTAAVINCHDDNAN